MSDFIASLLANVAESAIEAAGRRRPAQGPVIRRTAPVAAQPWRPPELEPTVIPAVEPPPRAAAAPVRTPTAPARGEAAPQAALRLFATRPALLHALVASEVLAPPVALREDNLWGHRGV